MFIIDHFYICWRETSSTCENITNLYSSFCRSKWVILQPVKLNTQRQREKKIISINYLCMTCLHCINHSCNKEKQSVWGEIWCDDLMCCVKWNAVNMRSFTEAFSLTYYLYTLKCFQVLHTLACPSILDWVHVRLFFKYIYLFKVTEHKLELCVVCCWEKWLWWLVKVWIACFTPMDFFFLFWLR